MIGRVRRKLVRLARGEYYYDWHLFSRVTEDDVYLMSYPRSGSTWIRCLVTSYVHDTELVPELVEQTVPDPYRSRQHGEVDKRAYANRVMFKSHSPYVRLPARVVYLLRDGRDVMHSLYSADVRRANKEAALPLRDYYLTPHAFGTWHEHVTAWLDGLGTWPRERFMLLRYEDLVADPERHLTMLVEFLGMTVDTARITRAVAYAAKDRMAEVERRAGAGTLEFPGLTKGSWRDVLTDEDVACYEQVAGPALLRGHYELHRDLAEPVDATASHTRVESH